jgi:hypothetical protein
MVPRPNEVFLSHSSLDGPFVSAIADVLRQHGIPVWYSQTNPIGAPQWHDEIGAALRRCDWLAVVLSPNSVNSTWVKREVLYSLTDHRYYEKIVPILRESCDYRSTILDVPIDPDGGLHWKLRRRMSFTLASVGLGLIGMI